MHDSGAVTGTGPRYSLLGRVLHFLRRRQWILELIGATLCLIPFYFFWRHPDLPAPAVFFGVLALMYVATLSKGFRGAAYRAWLRRLIRERLRGSAPVPLAQVVRELAHLGTPEDVLAAIETLVHSGAIRREHSALSDPLRDARSSHRTPRA